MTTMTFVRLLIITGLILILIGGGIYLMTRWNIPFGKLPGDIHITLGNVTCFIPIVSMLFISLILTVILNLVLRIMNRK